MLASTKCINWDYKETEKVTCTPRVYISSTMLSQAIFVDDAMKN